MQFDVRKILIISPGGIGDLIMFEPCLRILRNNFSDAKIDIFAGFTPVSGRVIWQEGMVNRLIDFEWGKNSFFSKIKFVNKLRKEKYDLSIVTTGVNPFMGGLFSCLVGAKIRVGEIRHKKKSIFYTHASLLEKDKHVTETSINLLKAVGLKIGNNALLPSIRVSNKEEEFARDFLKNNNLSDKIIIGFHPGCGENQKFRRWPKEYFVELGRKILYNFQYAAILIFGGPGEEEICENIKSELGDRAMVITKRPIEEVLSLIKNCALFVSSESGLNHSAAALKVETISIFGPTNPTRTGPRGPNVYVMKSECRYPYNMDTLKNYDADRPHSCLRKITPEIVFSEVEKKLNNNKIPKPYSPDRHLKGWGFEDWINNREYCGKLLVFFKGKKCSFHYHEKKHETFYLFSGKMEIKVSWEDDISTAKSYLFSPGDCLEIPTRLRHQMLALEDSNLFEFSTTHFDEDSKRIIKGD